jgi:hypothetical protein
MPISKLKNKSNRLKNFIIFNNTEISYIQIENYKTFKRLNLTKKF